MARGDITCRVTVGILNPETGKSIGAGSFVTVHPSDEGFGQLIGKILIPVDRNGNDLPSDRWPQQREEEAEVAAVAAEAPDSDVAPDVPPPDAAQEPQEAPGDASASPEGETLTPGP